MLRSFSETILFFDCFTVRTITAVAIAMNTAIMMVLGNSGTTGDEVGVLEVPEVGVGDAVGLEDPDVTAVTALAVS